jgi:DNA polymerase-3 subunit epsilon
VQQTDLFKSSDGSDVTSQKSASVDMRHSRWIKELEKTGDYRIIRRLIPRSVSPRNASDEKIGVIVDVETTGLDHAKDEIIELGMVAFTFGEEGKVQRVIGAFSELRQPSIPIPDEIVQLTGITDAMVLGKSIDDRSVADFVADASLVIAHNAKFDRPFCEHFSDAFTTMAWACSFSEVDWSSLGFEGAKLGYLLNRLGWFHNGHRASDDCHALLEILDAPLPGQSGNALQLLLHSAKQERHRVWAERSPFEFKDILKGRGYRWNDGSDGRPKSWWVEIPDTQSADELRFLQSEIYQRDVDLYVQRLTSFDRFKL